MYAVGKLSSYITQGVYTVSGPFHPFGGAVDMVVVQQQDGSLKSSPWYVKFGKFQGVLKAKERVVDINVNGIDADFHMYLDPRGEAYFLREVDSEIASPVSSTCEDIERKDNGGKMAFKSKSMNYEFDQCDDSVSSDKVLARNNSKRSRILGFVLGRRSMKEHMLSNEENNDSNVGRIAADLLEMNWSTNRASRNKLNTCNGSSNDNEDIIGGRLETSLVLHEQHFVNKLDENKEVVDEEHKNSSVEYYEESSITRLDDCKKEETGLVTGERTLEIVSESCTKVASSSNQQGDTSSVEVVSCSSVAVSVCQTEDDNINKHTQEQVDESYETNEIKPPLDSNCEFQDVSADPVLIKQVSETFVEEQFIFSDVDDSKPSVNDSIQEVDQKYDLDPRPVRTHLQRFKVEVEGLNGNNNIRRCTSTADIPRKRDEDTKEEVGRKAKSLPNLWSQFDDPIQDNHEDSQFYSPVTKFRTSKWDMVRDDASRIVKGNLEKELPHGADNLSSDIKDGGASDINGAGGSWSLWPFKRSVTKLRSPKDEETSKKDSDVDIVSETDVERETPSPQSSSSKMNTRALTPTPEQLASLNLAEGRNTVTFTFSTSVLGPQKVDARIYLWRWDTRIVISDVDGTITKSDVLGQFMPLVGRDWSHIGVTHLFSGIKENGYQMMYLSARAISQASITRQFLFNLKQDGKALPDGPVVISPDGLFPSLFREVIRRAPHEFKIACLEDIKACFPSDRNPFYAGFGNRDTDEFSYLKVGIPKGKIFIINPKGEVVVNRCIDSKSYASLHALVNDIFPPISVHEEEDYNSWNFWKLPPPDIE